MSALNGRNGYDAETVASGTMATETPDTIVFSNVSKFYGEILGVNRVNLVIRPGITSLVGPNGSGKTTLMNLVSGLLRPSRGTITVLGVPVDDAEGLGRRVGYCTQVDSFPPGMTGYDFVYGFLRVGGCPAAEAATSSTPRSARWPATRRACASGSSWRWRSATARASSSSTSR